MSDLPALTYNVALKLIFAIQVGLSLLLIGCGSVSGPEYQTPDTPNKTKWTSESLNADEVIRRDWWKNFGNPVLDSLIQKALENNLDLKVLAARVDLAESAIKQSSATRLPTLDAAIGSTMQGYKGLDTNVQQSYATAVGWELDIWGKLKKGVQAQEAAYQASEADWRAGYLELASNVAAAYFQVSQYDEQIEAQQHAVENADTILAIFRNLYAEGIIPQTQILQQQAELNRLNADLIELQRMRTLGVNTLATLTGTPAGDLQLPQQSMSDALPLIEVPAGLPSDLIARRPDLKAAEFRVLQAYHLEGQARLAKLPSIRLTSNFGSTSGALTDLLKGWNFGLTPTSTIPIFDPNVRARHRVSKAQAQVTQEEYRATVIRSFEEVEAALVNLSSHRQQHIEFRTRLSSLEMVSEQVQAQLREGMVSQLQLLESQRSVLAARLALVANHAQVLSDTVLLYKALGGGWTAEDYE